MDADPANMCYMYFLITNCKNNNTGSGLFAVTKVLPI